MILAEIEALTKQWNHQRFVAKQKTFIPIEMIESMNNAIHDSLLNLANTLDRIELAYRRGKADGQK